MRVVGRFANAGDITVRMLLGHRSGIPEWDTPLMDIVIAHHPGKVWTIEEKLDLAAAQPPVFAPGTSYKYCNTEYNLLGLVIEHVHRALLAPGGGTPGDPSARARAHVAALPGGP